MNWELITLLTFGLIFLLLFMGVPVAAGLGVAGIAIAYLFLGNMGIVGFAPWQLCNSFILSAIPLFILMGNILRHGGLSEHLYDGSTALVGGFRGGLLHTNIVSCAIFAAISGSSVATAATLGTIAIPALEKRKYETRIVLGSLAAGGTLGILIPPSIPLIIYGAMVEESVGRLFIAGFLPGIMLALLFMLYIWLRVTLQPKLAPTVEHMPLKRRLTSIIGMWPIIFLITIILGGIYAGVMTPSEAAALGCTLALIFSLVYRKMTWAILQDCMMDTVKISTMVIFIIVGASAVTGTLGLLRVPGQIATFITTLGLTPLVILMLIYLMYLFLGCFFEGISMMVLTLPVIFPVISTLGYDPIWFGIALVILIEMAALTPPVGLNLFTIHGLRPDHPIAEVVWGSMPFFLIMIVGLAIITAFPIIATWLPSTMMKLGG